jgi:8-oxo-dGTP pyrophosphatase MutT (NUDIX family)
MCLDAKQPVLPYAPPSYSGSGEAMVPAANPKNVEGSDQGNIVKIHPGFIKLLPKLTEKKVIAKSMFELKNQNVGYLPSEDIDAHFRNQTGFDSNDCSVEYLVIRRAKKEGVEDPDLEDNRNSVFSGYTSLPGGINYYGENSLDAVVRNTYEQTGIDLTDHSMYCMVAQSSKNFVMRYLANKRVIVAKPFIFCQMVPEAIQLPKPAPNFVSM